MAKTQYRIEYVSEIEHSLKKVPKNILIRIKKAIEERLKTNPKEYGKSLKGNLAGLRRLRVGDYRIIYRVFEEKVLVLIIAIDDRKSVYDQ